MKEYLTQERLEEFLNQLYPDGEWLFNKAVSKTINQGLIIGQISIKS
jgi:hypothetical protein